jgi:hypothetical protein
MRQVKPKHPNIPADCFPSINLDWSQLSAGREFAVDHCSIFANGGISKKLFYRQRDPGKSTKYEPHYSQKMDF